MKITDLLNENTIIPDLKARDKKGVLEELVKPVSDIVNISHEDLVRVLMDRERLGSTGIGDGIGIPHGKLKGIDSLVIGFGMSKHGVDFESLDNRPTHLFFLIITPEESTGLHLKLLAQISKLLKNESFRERLLGTSDRNEIFNIIKEEDEDF
ncbi:MAG: PTS sugar transporter subunit IIA [Proteobacteria bacterium]|nr:PTS sugar transporter subunit IIA [Pseudomonadota bacterium]